MPLTSHESAPFNGQLPIEAVSRRESAGMQLEISTQISQDGNLTVTLRRRKEASTGISTLYSGPIAISGDVKAIAEVAHTFVVTMLETRPRTSPEELKADLQKRIERSLFAPRTSVATSRASR